MHFAISHRPTRGSISSYNIAGLISEVFEEVATQIAKIAVVNHPTLIWRPANRNPCEYLHIPYISRNKIHWLHFCRCMYGSIFIPICALGSKRRIFSAPQCVLGVQGRSGSSKVDDFGTNRKHVCDLLLVRHCDYGAILHRFWDTAIYWLIIAYFSYPSLIRRPRSLCSLWNFAVKLSVLETRVMGLSYSEDTVIVAWVVLTQCQRVADGRSDGLTDGRTDLLWLIHRSA